MTIFPDDHARHVRFLLRLFTYRARRGLRALSIAARALEGRRRTFHDQVRPSRASADTSFVAAEWIFSRGRHPRAGSGQQAKNVGSPLGGGGSCRCPRAGRPWRCRLARFAADPRGSQVRHGTTLCASDCCAALRIIFHGARYRRTRERGSCRRCYYPGAHSVGGSRPCARGVSPRANSHLCAASNHGIDRSGRAVVGSLYR